MSDEPEKVAPQHVVAFFLLPDGNFAMDCTEDEKVGRYLLSHGMFELDRYYQRKRLEREFKKVQDEAVVNRMLGKDAETITRKLRSLKK